VIFASNRTGSVGLWTIPVSGGKASGAPELIKSDLGQISPLGITRDGALLYADHRGMDDIYLAELDSESGKLRGQPSRLIEDYIGRNSAPVWSPDGKFLAYFCNRDPARAYGAGTSEIIVRSVETGSERVFSGAKLSLRQAVRWAPDGQSLLIAAKETDSRQRTVFNLLNLATGKMRTVARAYLTLPFPVMLPDGSAFLVAGGDQSTNLAGFTSYDLATGDAREIWRAPPGWILRNLATSPGGLQVAFHVANSQLRRNVIYTLPTSGGEPHEVVRMEESIAREGLAWTADGKFLLFAQAQGPERNELFRVPAAGGVPESTGLAARGLSLISPHPDGTHLAYTVGQYFRVDIWALEHFLPTK
jgi:Tol biopolymer transport system component